jgi:Ca-activated chloride channel family protein
MLNQPFVISKHQFIKVNIMKKMNASIQKMGVRFLSLFLVMISLSCDQRAKLEEPNESVVDIQLESVDMEIVGMDAVSKSEIANPNPSNTERYAEIVENEFLSAKENPLSTFSIDVDNASYANVRRMIENGEKPEKGAVRIEEMINYFSYDYPNPTGETPFSVTTELTQAPWNEEHQLLRIGIQGKKIDYENVKPSNLVFLIDVSGSMSDTNKLPLLVRSFKLMTQNLDPKSKVAIVTYAGDAGVVLESTSVKNLDKIEEALDALVSGGSTNGAGGIEMAYKIARENFIEGGNNRVILATDGDFNVGNTSESGLLDLIQKEAKSKVFLTVCGFGMGNYNDQMMEVISNKGNGNYFYIDNWGEAQKVFKRELTANLFTIAKDVKIQVEFNPNTVESYRLIGYENRLLNKEDFNDDTKDAGELGAGHNVTALYEIVPKAGNSQVGKVDPLKYQSSQTGSNQKDLMTLKLRYKPINSETSKLITKVISTSDLKSWEKATTDQKFVSAVAGFGLLLRDSKYAKDYTYSDVMNWAKKGLDKDEEGYRAEFVGLVRKAEDL